ncbi:TRAP transporter, DctM subunit [Palleronia marisminoris]|uniref:TRAP transporter large permease protein n=1 Tax=Palleronia marisminoris TaxID=315423 RepID=A0A1Y5TQY8_9RHOB|nr:TRAP transporter large permease [Palleronia marisminoris]SFH41467.1 TRAP transporter, DctM subunit [Palleronia marisminoris]SLN66063.1 Sialic acid TRAP transporter permease protein SiaT [Palleronia marisminoris]
MNVAFGFWGIGILFLLLLLRVPVALALVAVSFGGIVALLGLTPALGIVSGTPYDFVASWTLSAVPMFLLMGFVAYHSGLTGGLFAAAKLVLARVPGGLAVSSIFACSGFAAVSGSSLACAAAMGRIAIPEMVAAGYRPSIAAGCIAAGGTIGALIPPSILMIIYGVFAETSITQVFLGGVSVGLLTAVSYALVVMAICVLRPDVIPRSAPVDMGDAGRAVRDVAPVIVLVVLVLGGLFAGFFTATEAGAVGAAGAIAIAAASGRLTRDVLTQSLTETLMATAALFIIGVGAAMFTRFLGLSGLSGFISQAVASADLSFWQLMVLIVVIYLLLGTFMEPFGALFITLPVLLPVVEAQGASLVWFGVLVVKLLEVGMITPPVGMNVFIIRSVASKYVSLTQIFAGVVPFILADIVVVALIIAVPGIVLFLPDLFG